MTDEEIEREISQLRFGDQARIGTRRHSAGGPREGCGAHRLVIATSGLVSTSRPGLLAVRLDLRRRPPGPCIAPRLHKRPRCSPLGCAIVRGPTNLITAGGVTSGIDFGLRVVADLAGDAVAQGIQLSRVRSRSAICFRSSRSGVKVGHGVAVSSGFSTVCRLPCFFSRSLKASAPALDLYAG
jgi:hypothetical protein